jgi:hypothetical protein
MKPKFKSTELASRRQAFELATWKRANQKKRGGYGPVLYDAGELGFCVLEWIGGHWVNGWFDRMEKL